MTVLKDVFNIFRFGDWATVTKNQDILSYALRCDHHSLDATQGLAEVHCGLRTNSSRNSYADMWDNQIGTRLRHRHSLLLVKNIRTGQQIEFMGVANHVPRETKAHSGFL